MMTKIKMLTGSPAARRHELLPLLTGLTLLAFGTVGCESKNRVDDPAPTTRDADMRSEAVDLAPAIDDQKKSMGEAAPAAGMSRTSTIDLQEGDVSVIALQHGSFMLQTDRLTVYVDPVTDALAFLDPETQEKSAPDLILLTDIHGDHFDLDAVKRLAKEGTIVVAPQAVVDKAEGALDRALVMANGDTRRFEQPQALTLTATPMYNLERTPEGSQTPFHVKGRGNGYILDIAGGKIYISGDTECTPEMKALEGIDAAFVTMNLPYTMPVEEAAECIREFKPGAIYPFHHRGQDPSKLTALLAGVEGVEVRLLDWYPGTKEP